MADKKRIGMKSGSRDFKILGVKRFPRGAPLGINLSLSFPSIYISLLHQYHECSTLGSAMDPAFPVSFRVALKIDI